MAEADSRAGAVVVATARILPGPHDLQMREYEPRLQNLERGRESGQDQWYGEVVPAQVQVYCGVLLLWWCPHVPTQPPFTQHALGPEADIFCPCLRHHHMHSTSK